MDPASWILIGVVSTVMGTLFGCVVREACKKPTYVLQNNEETIYVAIDEDRVFQHWGC